MDETISVTFTITGIAPLLMHNGQTADPLNHFAKAMKQLSGKRKKTDEDLEVMAALEWWAGLYLTKTAAIGDDFSVTAPDEARTCLPAHLLDSVIREGARKSKMGKQASAGVIVEGDAKLTHEGSANVNQLATDPRFVARHAVKVSTSKVMRTRPMFSEWSAEFSVCIDPGVIDVSDVRLALSNAGRLVGIGDWRPGAPRGGSFGRFVLEDAA
jgi:hypothetical protein